MSAHHIIELAHKLAAILHEKKVDDEEFERDIRSVADSLIEFPSYDTLRARVLKLLEKANVDASKLREVVSILEKFSRIDDPMVYSRLAINLRDLAKGYRLLLRAQEEVSRRGG